MRLIQELLFNEALKMDKDTVASMRVDELFEYATFAADYFKQKRAEQGLR